MYLYQSKAFRLISSSRKVFKLGPRTFCSSKANPSNQLVETESSKLKSKYDVIVIGAGHNGLVTAAYMQKAGLNVCVLERRHVIGGAAVTEEIIPGFKFSRASYVLSLLRPKIVQDLELKKYGLKVYIRDPTSYTPLLEPGGLNGKARSLTLSHSKEDTAKQIAQFSTKDAEKFFEYEAALEKIVRDIEPLLDTEPFFVPAFTASKASFVDRVQSLQPLGQLVKSMVAMGKSGNIEFFMNLMTTPATKVLDKWFESEPLKATLATDSVIGAMINPNMAGSGYVLLHHVMGELEGIKGAWGYVEGGMGGVSKAIANSAMDQGASVFTNKPVDEILVENDAAKGVRLIDGTVIHAKAVLSNATPKVTFLDLVPKGVLPLELVTALGRVDYTSPVTKINVALSRLPNFTADPNVKKNEPMPHHQCTIHMNSEHSDLIDKAYFQAQAGTFSKRPIIEMVIPSSVDPTLAPPGSHVCSLFTQYTPYTLSGREWDDNTRNEYADLVFDCIEQYAPGFKDSVIGRDILTPPDLEKIFGLTGGNIFHGVMSFDQLYSFRPLKELSNYRSPIKGLYLCGSGGHPGGGVMGSAGRLAAEAAMRDFKKL